MLGFSEWHMSLKKGGGTSLNACKQIIVAELVVIMISIMYTLLWFLWRVPVSLQVSQSTSPGSASVSCSRKQQLPLSGLAAAPSKKNTHHKSFPKYSTKERKKAHLTCYHLQKQVFSSCFLTLRLLAAAAWAANFLLSSAISDLAAAVLDSRWRLWVLREAWAL